MLRQLLRFEAFYQLKQKALPLLAVLFALFGYVSGSNGFAPANVNFNASYQVYKHVGLFTLGTVFIIMFFAVTGVLRDSRYKMDELIYSSPLEKIKFFLSRFAGVYIFSVLTFTPFLLGMMAGYHMAPHDPARVAPFNLILYASPWLTTALPNIFISTTILFSVSMLTRSTIATYASAVVMYAFYFITSIFLNSPLMANSVPASPEAMAVAALADPFGISAFYAQTQFWTPIEKSTLHVSFSGLYLWNRILWLWLSTGILFITYRLFSFRKLSTHVKKKKKVEESNVEAGNYTPIEPVSSRAAHRVAWASLLKLELKSIIKSLPFIAITLVWLVIIIVEIYSRVFQGGQYSDSLYPLTSIMIANMVDPLKWISLILIVFYSGELVWNERSLSIDGIVDATPVPNWVVFLSKFCGLLLLPAILILSGIAIGIAFQLSSGFFQIEPGQYLSVFYYRGMQLFLFTGLAMFIQSTVRNKYVGMGITGIIILSSFLPSSIGIEHPILRFAFLPNVVFSNMTGYSGFVTEYLHLLLYWLGLVGMLVLLAFKLWQRGSRTAMHNLFKSKWETWEKVSFTGFAFLFVLAGSLVFYTTNVTDEYTTESDVIDFREHYERNFKKYEELPFLYAQSIATQVDLYPKGKRYKIKADYVMVNKDDKPMKKIFITAKVPLQSLWLENAKLVTYNEEFDTYVFEFSESVMPGQTVKMKYEIDHQSTGYAFDRNIIKNGTYLMHGNFEPFMGYQQRLEITDAFERTKRGLPPQENQEVLDEHLNVDGYKIKAEKVSYETTISTASNEIALASGELVKQWKDKGRNYFTYKAKEKIIPSLGYISSAYAIKEEEYKGVNIELYFYPDHAYNIDSIMASAEYALDYCKSNFGDYPLNYLRIAEVPAHWSFGGFAHPGLISMVEDRLYYTDISNPDAFNLVAKRTIHEVGHQWWGHALVPKIVEGGSLLVEGLAKYTEAVVMEKHYGKRAVYQLTKTANRRYFTGRAWASEEESPLYQVKGQGYLSYGKSLQVMLALKDLIGEAEVNNILKTMVERYRNKVEFEATSTAFIDEVYKATPDKYHTLIDDWFKRVITYDLSIANVSHRKLEDGRFEVTLILNAQRFEEEASGNRKELEINEPIQIGLFSIHPGKIGLDGGVIHLKPHIIKQSKQEIKLIVNKLPHFASIDPFGTRTDKILSDNVVLVK